LFGLGCTDHRFHIASASGNEDDDVFHGRHCTCSGEPRRHYAAAQQAWQGEFEAYSKE